METPRPGNRRPRRIALARGPFLLIVAFAGFFGAMVGFFFTLVLDPFAVKLKESPFGPELAARLPKGADFSGVGELEDMGREEQETYREILRLAAAGEDAKASVAADMLAAAKAAHPLAAGTAAYLHLRPGPGRPPALAKASALLEAALAGGKDRAHPWLLYVAALLHETAGRSDSALAGYLRTVRLSPQFAYPYAAVGRIQLARGETGLASASFRKAIGLMTTAPERYRASDRYRAGDGSALPLAEPAPFDWLATLYLQVGAADSARMALEYGLEKGWRTDRMELVQGWLWEVSGFLPKADSVYRRLLAKDPGNPEAARALVTLGWKPYRAAAGHPPGKGARAAAAPAKGIGKAEDAAAVLGFLDPLARQYPGNAPLWMALGQAYHQRGLPGRALEAFDSALAADPALPGLKDKREAARADWAVEQGRMAASAPPSRRPAPPSAEDQAAVVLPGSIALLGTYSVSWGATAVEVRQAYPAKTFRNLPTGDLMDEFMLDGVQHQYLLAFKDGGLWGIRVFVTDSAGVGGDLFGRLIRTKTKISGEGKGTGEAACPGFLPFQGAIWENDDTFEFMAQFSGKESQIRLARIDRRMLPHNRRLCDLVPFLKAETWEKGGGPSLPAPPKAPKRPAAPRPSPKAVVPPMPDAPPEENVPNIVVPPGVDPYQDAPVIPAE